MAYQLNAWGYQMPAGYVTDPRFQVVQDGEAFERVMRELVVQKALTFDFETSGLAWYHQAEAIGIALGYLTEAGTTQNYYVPFRHRTGERQLSIETVGLSLKSLLENPNTLKIAHNYKFDAHMARREGWRVAGPIYDTMIAAHFHDENRSVALKERAVHDLGDPSAGYWENEVALENHRLAKQQNLGVKAYLNEYGYSLLPIELCGVYAAHDTEYTTRLWQHYEKVVGVSRLYGRAFATEQRVIPVLVDMEQDGVEVDTFYLEDLKEKVSRQRDVLGAEIATWMRPYRVNIGSDAELREYLLNVLHVPLSKFTKSKQLSVDYEALVPFKDVSPLIPLILEWREANKIATTYTDSILSRLDANKTLHCDFKQIGTSTGRLSCIAKGTLVETVRDVSAFPKGIPIEDVTQGTLVYCYDIKGRLTISPVTKAWRVGRKSVLRLHWRGSGNKHSGHLDLTPDHLVRLKSGEWRAAEKLLPGDRVTALSRGVTLDGYARLWPTGAPEIKREHQFIYKTLYGQSPAHVHHRNGHKLDNRPENLIGLSASEHTALHGAHTSTETREFRRQKMLRQHSNGLMVNVVRGADKSNWLGVSASYLEEWLLKCNWSVTNAARLSGHDFATFKRYVKAAGYSLSELRQRNRATRTEQILASASHARWARLGYNHVITSVELLPVKMEVYDLTVKGAECFIAGELCVHNCASPNLQNIPSDDDARAKAATGLSLKEGGVDPWSLKRAFKVPNGSTRLLCDYSQIELRVLAFYSGDKIMREVYAENGDIHARTAMEVFGRTDSDAVRRQAKIINFGLCLKGGQTVLTDHGLFPIEDVRDWHKVWDGVEWVSHSGVVCRGFAEVVTYDGLTATPDHQVYTEDGYKVPIGCLVEAVHPRRLAIGAIGPVPVGYTAFDGKDAGTLRWSSEPTRCGSCVWCLQKNNVGAGGQCTLGQEYELHLPGKVQGFEGTHLGWQIRCYGAALRSRYSRFLSALQGAWHKSVVYVQGTFHNVGAHDVPGFGFQGFGFRQTGQRRPLRASEYEAGVSVREFTESSEARGRPLQGGAPIVGGQSAIHRPWPPSLQGVHEASHAESLGQEESVLVYDILNAGPRHRFTVSGKIVSNSYCLSAKGFSRQSGMGPLESEAFMKRFFERYRGIAAFREYFWKFARAHGNQFVNIFGRPRQVPGLAASDAFERGRAERQAIGSLIQGTAAELTKESLVRLHDWIREAGIPAKLKLTIHDEIQLDVDNRVVSEVAAWVQHHMENFPEFQPIPIIVDVSSTTTNWSEKKKRK